MSWLQGAVQHSNSSSGETPRLFLCKIGWHSWGGWWRFGALRSFKVVWWRRCARCGEIERRERILGFRRK